MPDYNHATGFVGNEGIEGTLLLSVIVVAFIVIDMLSLPTL
jgi:hypothetical protein